MRILIATGIYPPDIGGPAQYAQNLFEEFGKQGYSVWVSTYNLEKKLPTGLRHIFFFCKSFIRAAKSNFIIALDTFSVGLPTVILGKLLRKKVLLRVGGDFLWETYTARGGRLGLKDFYQSMPVLTLKEKIIYGLFNFILKNSYVVFTTNWQKQIVENYYKLEPKKCFVVENFYGEKIESLEPKEANFIVAARPVKFKNLDFLKTIFSELSEERNDAKLEVVSDIDYKEALEKIRGSYAAILLSFSDIGPNFILDAVRANKPFIMTKETGLYDRLKDVGIFVDPNNKEEIKNKILSLLGKKTYQEYVERVSSFSFTHSWSEIAQEFINIYKTI